MKSTEDTFSYMKSSNPSKGKFYSTEDQLYH